MGFFSKLFGKEEDLGEESWRDDPAEMDRRAIKALTQLMGYFMATESIATSFGEKPIPKNPETLKIQTAFAFGINDFICNSNGIDQAQTFSVFNKFLSQEYGKEKGAKLSLWILKNAAKPKFLKIMKIAGQSAVDHLKNELENKIIFYDTMMDKKNKL